MEENVPFDNKKFISTIYEVSKEDFRVSDDTVLDKLYFHLGSSINVDDLLSSLSTEIGEWLESVVHSWTSTNLFYGVKVFTIRVIGFVGSSSDGFGLLKARNILLHIQNLSAINEVQLDSCLMVPLINTLAMFLKHQDGWNWLTETGVWKCAINAFYFDKSMYTNRAGVKFVSLLLTSSKKYDNSDDTVATEILSFACEPLMTSKILFINQHNSSSCSTMPVKDSISAEKTDSFSKRNLKSTTAETIIITKKMSSAAKFVCDVLKDILSRSSFVTVKLSMAPWCVGSKPESELTLNTLILKSSYSSSEEEHTFALLLLMINLNIASKRDCDASLESDTCHLRFVHSDIYRVVSSMTNEGHFFAVVNFCVICLLWINKFKKMNNSCKHNCGFCDGFEKTMISCMRILLQLQYESFGLSRHQTNMFMTKVEKVPGLDMNIAELLFEKVSCECLSDLNQTQKLSIQYIQLGLFGLSRSLKFVTNDHTVLDIFLEVSSTLDILVKLLDRLQDLVKPVILNLLSLTSVIIEEYRLPHWTIDEEKNENLLLVILRLLGTECLDVRVTVTSLQVLNKILKFHIMPDVIGKVETVKHMNIRKQLSDLSLLKSKLESDNWEVRDTALEVFQTMIELAEPTPWLFLYPFENTIVVKILVLMISDESSYVQASALSFFSKVVRGKLFSNMVSPQTLLNHSMKLVLEDTMPMVRQAASELITALYITYVPSELSDHHKIFEAMFTVIAKDLNWEVKKAALSFWRCTIDKHMSDEKIPMHPSLLYFSKLTDKKQIALQIVEVLTCLGEIGCLKAIWIGLNDDCDIKVSLEALAVLNHLKELDRHWNFIETILKNDNCADTGNIEETSILHKQLLPVEFFSLIQKQDWKEVLNSRRRWIENNCDDLTSLMDHILNADNKIDDWDHNAVDCY